MKHLLAILILTLVLACTVHSYVLEARGSDGRLSARGPGDNNNNNDDDGDEDNGGECEPVLGLLTGYTAAGCGGVTSSLAIVIEEQDICGSSIVINTCTTFTPATGTLSFQLNRATDSIYCILYADDNCSSVVQVATLRANDGDETGTCFTPATGTTIGSVECYDMGDED